MLGGALTCTAAGALSALPNALETVTVYTPAEVNATGVSDSVAAVPPVIEAPSLYHW